MYIVSESREGTGILIDRDKHLVLTTSRVVGDSDRVSVQFPYHNLDGTIETDRTDYARSAAAKLTPMGRVIHRDKARELALVQLDRLGRDAHPLELAESGIRETVLHIGAGTGKLFPMTVRKVVKEDGPAITLSGATDDSGGSLVDSDGKLAGVVVGPADQNATLAIGIAEVRAFLADKDQDNRELEATPKTAPPGVRGKVIAIGEKDKNLASVDIGSDFGLSVGNVLIVYRGIEFLGKLTLTNVSPKVSVGKFVPNMRTDTVQVSDLVATSFTDTPVGLTARDVGPPVGAEDLYDLVVNSCVFIITPTKGGFAMGSGSLIDAEKRYVITNYQLVQDKDFVFAQFPTYVRGKRVTDKKTYIENVPAGKAMRAKVLHRDKNRDLAVIQLEKIPPGTKAIVLAKDSPRIGTAVYNIGSQGAVEQLFSMTEGKVRAVGPEDHLVGDGTAEGAFRVRAVMVTTTNPTNPGDSGGPLFNKNGEQVGVTESGRPSAQQMNFCIDVSEVRAFLNEKKITIKKSDDDEKAAADKLQSAKLFADGEENRDVYKSKLNAIIRQYPNTAAAEEAKKLLDKLK